jgi:DNA polymerase I-like protein with 3'-5' exonuclease and polymerase domains
MKHTTLLIDGNALLYRAYHAFPKELTTPTQEPIGAVFGFCRILFSTLKVLKPQAVAVCFDLKGPTFRHLEYDQYKATRQKMPEELAGQIERMYQVVETLEMPIYTCEGFEADDVIGTLSLQIRNTPGQEVIILTGDQDIIQLVDDCVSVYTPGGFPKQPVMYTPEKVRERYGFNPDQMVDYKALRGDPSDNIPGVPGIGEVTATKLIQDFKTLDLLYAAIAAGTTESIKPAVLLKLKNGEESARLSLRLATICRDVPIEYDTEKGKLELLTPDRLVDLFKELGFKSLLKELPASHRLVSEAADVFSSPEDSKEPEVTPLLPTSESEKTDLLLAPILRAMEERGVKVDCGYLQDLEKEFAAELEQIRKQIVDFAGEEFNPDSPSQVGHVLYEVLHIPTANVRKGKTGYTTDAATLQTLAEEYPIAARLLDYRELMKLQNTYVKPLQGLVDENSRIHTSYAPDTSTGRISSRNPNLQNIPIRSEQGRRLRKAFITDPDKILLSADYSQIELRLAAHLANDPVMMDIFQSGRDFHTETAERMHVDRRTAKIINFSILYGKGAFSFAKDLNISVAEAKTYIDNYFSTFSSLRLYLDAIVQTARSQGYLETLYGRRLAFPALTGSNYQLRAAAEREAVNFPIQGTAADILKLAMCALDGALKESASPATMILTVHDELVLEVPNTPEDIHAAAVLLHDAMTHAATLGVPLDVHLKSGTNWSEMDELVLSDDATKD